MIKFIYLKDLIVSIFKILFYKCLYLNKIVIHSHLILKRGVLISCVNKGKLFFGKNVEISNNSMIRANGGKIVLYGKNYINRNSIIVSRKYIEIGVGTTIGPNCSIYDHDHTINNIYSKDNYTYGDIIIGKNVWIGAGVIILKGITIGDNSVIAAGSVISRNVPENSILIQKRKNSIKKRDFKI